MPCIPLGDGKSGLSGYACSRGNRQRECCACGRVGTKLCDFPLRGEKAGKTCDAPLCAKCAVVMGEVDARVDADTALIAHPLARPSHPHRRPLRRELVASLRTPDTVDYCPAHARAVEVK